METLTIIKRAIREKKVISFTYSKPDSANGTRFGNPHAVYKVSSKSGRGSIKVHIVQTGGVSDGELSSKSNFIVFDLRYIKDIQLKAKQASFEIDNRYNPNWVAYQNIIYQA